MFGNTQARIKMKTQLLIFVLLSTFSLSIFAADLSTPTGRVQDSIDKVIDILKDRSLDREARWEKVGVIIDDSFDFRSMSQSVLATNWKKATPEERKRFVECADIVSQKIQHEKCFRTGQQCFSKRNGDFPASRNDQRSSIKR